MRLAVVLVAILFAATNARAEPEAYYTEAQAKRGASLWETHCGACHSALPASAPANTPLKGFRAGGRTVPSNLGGGYILRKQVEGRRVFPSVYYLFHDFEAMPNVTDSISPQVRADILAFVLKMNGFPAGTTELKPDTRAMKLMPLDEPGFERSFNGRDFSGWKFLMGLGCTPPPKGCGKTEPAPFFVIKDGIIHGSRSHGLMYTEKKYTDFTLRMELLAEKPADWDSEDIFHYANTGIVLVAEENLEIWPKAVVYGGELREVLKPIPLSPLVEPTYDVAARDRARRPLGEWNAIEIVSKAGSLKAYLNGVLTTTIAKHSFSEPLHIGFQLQGFPIRWRNIRIREQ
jgi:mono/diheme cytochrome c family protein